MPAIPTPPPDNSGGFMIIQQTNGTDTHRMRIHVLPFSKTAFIVGGSTPSVSTDDGNHDYAYTPDRPAGMEAGVSDTFQAYINKIKYRFATSWTFTLLSLYQNVAGVLVEVFPTPIPTAIVGTSGGGTPTGVARCYEETWSFRTAGGNKANLRFLGLQNGAVPSTPMTVAGNSAGSADQQLVAYLNGSATGIVAHDGQKIGNVAHQTSCQNRRLRRHYGFA